MPTSNPVTSESQRPAVAKHPRLERRSLRTRATDLLRSDILSGRYAPGAKLLEVPLAESFGVSRGTLRSALQQLDTEGLVELIPYTGWRVANMSSRDAWELHTIRAMLEGLAADLAARSINKAKAEQLQDAYSRLLSACGTGDYAAATEADFKLHSTIIDLADHDRLRMHYNLIAQQTKLFLASSNKLFSNIEDIGLEHRPLVDAILAGDFAAAQSAAKALVERDGEELVHHLSAAENIAAKEKEREHKH